MASTKRTWVEEYQDQEFWQQLEGVIEATDNVVPSEAESIDQLNRIRLVAKTALECRDGSPILFTPGLATRISTRAAAVHTPLSQWRDGDYADDALIAQAFDKLPELQAQLRSLPVPASTSLRSAASTLRHAVKETKLYVETLSAYVDEFDEKHSQRLNEHLEAARSEFATLQEAVGAAETSVDEKLLATTQQISSLDTQLTSLERRANELLESLQRQFQAAEEKRASTHSALVSEHGAALDTAIDESDADLKKHFAEEQERITKHAKRIRQLRQAASNTVGAIGTQATSSWYEKNAEQQRKAADRWRWIAASLFVVAFLVVGWSVFLSDSEEDSWKSTVLKSTATATLVAGAVYASRESGKHRQKEFESKTTELTLRALDPFIANIDAPVRQQIRLDAARHVFSIKADRTVDDDYEYGDETDVLEDDAV